VIAWVQARYLDEETRTLLERIAEQNERVRDLANRIKEDDAEVASIFADQDRVRKNLSALGTSPDERSLRERFVKSLERDEDRLRELNESLAKLRGDKEAAERELKERATEISFEKTL
jgi:hypothetical protein